MLAENVHDATDSLHGNWEGMAADAAHVYFEKFRDAIYTEADAYSALQHRYEVVMEFIFEMHLLFDDVVNTVLDIVFTLLTADTGKGLTMAADLEEVPACEFDKLKDHHYQHPGDGEDF